jgi:hypothetical protein
MRVLLSGAKNPNAPEMKRWFFAPLRMTRGEGDLWHPTAKVSVFRALPGDPAAKLSVCSVGR